MVLEVTDSNSNLKAELSNFFQSGKNYALEYKMSGSNDERGD